MASTAAPTHVTESISDRKKQRELAEARQSGTAAPEVDVKTGSIINPHNPEFITKRPWYLGGNDAGPSLDHQADQRALSDRIELSLSSADRLVREQRINQKSISKTGFSAIKTNMWVEALKRNKKPYLMCRVIKIDKKRQELDVEYEDGKIEKNIRWKSKNKSHTPRVRLIKTGSRSEAIDHSTVGKETYDSKRDSYHGFEVEDQQKIIQRKFQEQDKLRKKLRKKEFEKKDQDDEEKKNKETNRNAGSDSDYDSDDSDYDSDAGSDSDDEFVQKDEQDKMFTSRLARQGGVGGAQMKITARNLRIREDTAKYLRNLDPNSAYYDPKSRSMRDNPNPEINPEEVQFAGDNFSRISGDAVGLAETQLFAWDASDQGLQEIHPQANPSQAELLKKTFKNKSADLKTTRKRAVLDKYGGAQYLDGKDGLGDDSLADNHTPNNDNNDKEAKDRKIRFGTTVKMDQYTREGRLVNNGPGGINASSGKSKYNEDVFSNGHTTVFGSYFHKGAFCWGFSDDHSLMKNSYCTGINGRKANDNANEMRYGDGRAGSAQVAQLREMLGGANKSQQSSNLKKNAPPVHLTQSKLYGEADQFASLDNDKVSAAMANQTEKEDTNKRGYSSMNADNNVTAEEMEAYRLKKSRGGEDPMANSNQGEILEYKK